MHVGSNLQENGSQRRLLAYKRYALVAPRLQAQKVLVALRSEANKFVHSKRNMTASSLKDSSKSQSGCAKLSGRFASHLSKDILGMGSSDIV